MGDEGALSLGQRVAHIRRVVAGILASREETMLDLKRRLVRELAMDPTPQSLQGLAALREIKDPLGREIGMRSVLLHFALEWSSQETWNALDADPSRLRRAVGLAPPLVALAASVEDAFDEAIGKVDRLERDAVGRLHALLHLPDDALLAAIVVIPEVARLLEAGEAPARDRAVVDAIALRTLMERDLAQYLVLGPGAEDEATRSSRRDLRRRLQSEREVHEFVSRRVETGRPQSIPRTRAENRALDRARRTLFATYLQVSTALAGQTVEAEDDLRARILEAEREAAAIDAEKATQRELIADAAAGFTIPLPDHHVPPTDVRALARERRRTRFLVGIAAALVPCALTANVLFYRGEARALATSPEFLSSVLPVREIMPIGQALYSQVSTLLWEDLSAAERRDRVKALGKLAAQRGYRVVLVVDEARRERARWSLTHGTELAEDQRPN